MQTTVTQIAKVCHEVNRAYCQSIGDFSQPIWEEAPGWQISSAIAGVRFHLENPNSNPQDSHINWLKDKLAAGWVYGDVKDEAKKTHPCMMDFDKLSPEQRSKDHLFRQIVHSLRGELEEV